MRHEALDRKGYRHSYDEFEIEAWSFGITSIDVYLDPDNRMRIWELMGRGGWHPGPWWYQLQRLHDRLSLAATLQAQKERQKQEALELKRQEKQNALFAAYLKKSSGSSKG